MISNYIAIGIICVGVIGCLITRHFEKLMWNNGICKESGKPWIQFDVDSQGGRGYKDKDGSNYMWISYDVDNIK